MSQTTLTTNDSSSESDNKSGIGFITESNSKEERRVNLNELCEAVDRIDGVEETVWDANPSTLQNAVLRPQLEHESVMFSNTVRIEADFRRITNEIKKVLEEHNEKHNSTWQEINPPQYVDTNEYREHFYEVEISMI